MSISRSTPLFGWLLCLSRHSAPTTFWLFPPQNRLISDRFPEALIWYRKVGLPCSVEADCEWGPAVRSSFGLCACAVAGASTTTSTTSAVSTAAPAARPAKPRNGPRRVVRLEAIWVIIVISLAIQPAGRVVVALSSPIEPAVCPSECPPRPVPRGWVVPVFTLSPSSCLWLFPRPAPVAPPFVVGFFCPGPVVGLGFLLFAPRAVRWVTPHSSFRFGLIGSTSAAAFPPGGTPLAPLRFLLRGAFPLQAGRQGPTCVDPPVLGALLEPSGPASCTPAAAFRRSASRRAASCLCGC